MLAYLDSSILLRRIFKEPGELATLRDFGPFISSVLLEVECFRTVHRAQLLSRISEEEAVRKSEEIYQHLQFISQVQVSGTVLQTAKRPFIVSLGTLDAMHLASALLWRERKQDEVAFLTHDERLAAAARAEGFEVHGASA